MWVCEFFFGYEVDVLYEHIPNDLFEQRSVESVCWVLKYLEEICFFFPVPVCHRNIYEASLSFLAGNDESFETNI